MSFGVPLLCIYTVGRLLHCPCYPSSWRLRERRWFVLERPRRDTNGGSESVSVFSFVFPGSETQGEWVSSAIAMQPAAANPSRSWRWVVSNRCLLLVLLLVCVGMALFFVREDKQEEEWLEDEDLSLIHI